MRKKLMAISGPKEETKRSLFLKLLYGSPNLAIAGHISVMLPSPASFIKLPLSL